MSSRSCACHYISPRPKTPPQDNEKSWAGKQAAGFKEWLNFTLVGAEELPHGAGRDDELMEKRPSSELSTPLKAMVAVVRAELLLYLSFKTVGARVLKKQPPPPPPKQKQKNGKFFFFLSRLCFWFESYSGVFFQRPPKVLYSLNR